MESNACMRSDADEDANNEISILFWSGRRWRKGLSGKLHIRYMLAIGRWIHYKCKLKQATGTQLVYIQDRLRQYKTVICQSSVPGKQRLMSVAPEETNNGKHWFIKGNNGNYPLLGLSTHWQLGLTRLITAAEWSCPQKATRLDHDGDNGDRNGDDLRMKMAMIVMGIMAEKDVMGHGWLLNRFMFYVLEHWHLCNGSCLHCLWRRQQAIPSMDIC